jgi:hypothetical protein
MKSSLKVLALNPAKARHLPLRPGWGARISDLDLAVASRVAMPRIVITIGSPRRLGYDVRAYNVRGDDVDQVRITG